jgi:uncharacterized membrane protein/glutaredoxin
MGKPATGKARQNRKRTPEQAQVRGSELNWPVLILSLIGLGLAGYLTGLSWSGREAAFCEAGADCHLVLNSRWSELLGVPTSLWGFFIYAALIGTCFVKRLDKRWKWAVLLSTIGFVYSAYLTTISITQLEATCPYCLTSLGLLTVILVITLIQTPRHNRRLSWRPWLAMSVVGALVLVGGVHYSFYARASVVATSTDEDPWIRGLAEHLDHIGAKFYGASWCPHCKEQKAMFGASAKRLPYIECSPSGSSGPQSDECNAAGIQSYPTWFINGHRYTGVLTPSTLAEYSGYSGIETSTTKKGS